jgi:uroporphyrinogen-III synthase
MTATNEASVLAGRGVVITRPARQAGRLAEFVRAKGGAPLLFPAIEITAITDPRPLAALIARLDEFDLAIFISPNAVEHAFAAIEATRKFPDRLATAAIGRGTVAALERAGRSSIIAPARFDSETLLDLPQLKSVGGSRVVIFRGEGGRELLGDTLRARGACIEYAECYRRAQPALDPAPLLTAWAQGKVHAVTVTSSEGLHNFCAMLGTAGREWLRQTPLFAPHPRIGEAARDAGIAEVVLTPQGDEGLVQALCAFFAPRG